MTYEQLEMILRGNGHAPRREMTTFTNERVVTGLRIDTPPIALEDKKKRLQQLLAGMPVRVDKFPNYAYIGIEII